MKQRFLVAAAACRLCSVSTGFAQDGYLGPGWSISFADGGVAVDSLGPVLLDVTKGLFVGPYATSVAVSALAGATNLVSAPALSVSLQAEADANLMVVPGLTLGVGRSLLGSGGHAPVIAGY